MSKPGSHLSSRMYVSVMVCSILSMAACGPARFCAVPALFLVSFAWLYQQSYCRLAGVRRQSIHRQSSVNSDLSETAGWIRPVKFYCQFPVCRFLALLDYVSRGHEIEIRPSAVVHPSVCGIDYIWSYCMDCFQISVVASPGPYAQTFKKKKFFFFLIF